MANIEEAESRECITVADGDSMVEVPIHARMRHRKSRRPNRGGRPSRTSLRRQSISNAVIRPTPNEIYLAYWRKSKSWFAVLVLPHADIDRFGLADYVPVCYTHNKETGEFAWNKGYEDRGPLVEERQFPVMFFEGAKFPDRGAVGWISARDLQGFDVGGQYASLVPHYDQVCAFIKERSMALPGGEGLGCALPPNSPSKGQNELGTANSALADRVGDTLGEREGGILTYPNNAYTTTGCNLAETRDPAWVGSSQSLHLIKDKQLPSRNAIVCPNHAGALMTELLPTCNCLPPFDPTNRSGKPVLPALGPLLAATRGILHSNRSTPSGLQTPRLSPPRRNIDWPSKEARLIQCSCSSCSRGKGSHQGIYARRLKDYAAGNKGERNHHCS